MKPFDPWCDDCRRYHGSLQDCPVRQNFPRTNQQQKEKHMSTETKTPTSTNRIKLEGVRLSYPNLFTATAMEGGKPKFSASFLMDKKTHAPLIARIQKMIERVALDKFQKKVPLKNICLRDGMDKEDKEGYGEEVMYLVAKSDTRPPVVDGKLSPITEEDGKIYGGCYVNATVEVFAYSHPTGGKGVSAQLRAVQFAKDGPSFGAGPVHAEDEFEPVTDNVDDY